MSIIFIIIIIIIVVVYEIKGHGGAVVGEMGMGFRGGAGAED